MRRKEKAKISISRIDQDLEGKYFAIVQSIELLPEKRKVFISEEPQYREILRVEFILKGSIIRTKDMIFTLVTNSELGRFIRAIKGFIPDTIEDLSEELVAKTVVVDIEKNVKNGRTYFNIVDFESVEEYNERKNPKVQNKRNPLQPDNGSRIVRNSKPPFKKTEAENGEDPEINKNNRTKSEKTGFTQYKSIEEMPYMVEEKENQ